MSAIDFLFLHVPKYGKEKTHIPIMPVGIFALADYLDKHTINTRIVHHLLTRIGNFDIFEYIEKNDTKIVGLSLNWHHQSYHVIEVAKEIKEKFPKIKIILGGQTATYFAREILQEFPFIDFIVCGDAEVPLLGLVNLLLKRRPLSIERIPNLAWKNKNEVFVNQQSYTISQELYDTLVYTNFDLIEKKRDALRASMVIREYPPPQESFFYPNVSRACHRTCIHCGGSSSGGTRIFGRKRPIIRKMESVLKDIENVLKAGILSMCLPSYFSDFSEYYRNLFNEMYERRLRFHLIFDLDPDLPSEEFITCFKKVTMRACKQVPRSKLAYFLPSGTQAIRKKFGNIPQSNDEVVRFANLSLKNDLGVMLFFAVGSPLDTPESFKETEKLIRLFSGYQDERIEIVVYPVKHLDPGSRGLENPDRYLLKPRVRSFLDFYTYHKNDSDEFTFENLLFPKDRVLEIADRYKQYLVDFTRF